MKKHLENNKVYKIKPLKWKLIEKNEFHKRYATTNSYINYIISFYYKPLIWHLYTIEYEMDDVISENLNEYKSFKLAKLAAEKDWVKSISKFLTPIKNVK